MKKIIIRILILILNCYCISCTIENQFDEYEPLTTVDFGEGTYKPNPFKALDDIPPFSWFGMPDSVKKETKFEIQFNEDAIRSHSSGQLMLVDANGNKINGLTIGDTSTNSIRIEASSTAIIVPIKITIDPSVGDTILSGSIIVAGDNLDKVNDVELEATATHIADWKLRHNIGINVWRWILFILLLIVFAYLLYFILSSISSSLASFFSNRPSPSSTSNDDWNRKKSKRFKKKRNPFIVKCERILLSSASLSDKAVTLERLFNYWDYELPETEKDFEAAMLDPRVMNAMEQLWEKYYRYTKKNMSWSGEPQNSVLIPDKNATPPNNNYSNIDNLTWGQIMKKHKYKGLQYHKGKPDFSKLAQYKVEIADFDRYVNPDKDDDRGPLQEKAFEILTQNSFRDKGIEYVRKNIKELNRLVWHEDTDCKTLYLVPQEIHNNLQHFGGIGMLRILRNSGLVKKS